jgi:CRISPR-associated protein Cmr2
MGKDKKNIKLNDLKKLKDYIAIKGEKMSYEIINQDLKHDDNPIHFLKWAKKYDVLDGTKIKDMDNFDTVFPFATSNDKNDSRFKNQKNTEFALAWFKEKKFKKENDIKYFGISKEYKSLKNLNNLPDVNNLLPYSFIIQAEIKLKSSYFSRDDDEFYLIQNPCLKEKVFKVPMIRGSGWKGALAKAAKEFINEDLNDFESFVRIFGTGSQEYREVIESLEKDENISDKLVKYVLFELGKRLEKSDIEEIKSNPKEYLKKLSLKFTKEKIKEIPFLQVHKGRAIFYSTYFERLSLEIINPHSRKTRAGTVPIHYEVVPEDTEGTLQIVYIPYDAVLMKEKEIKNEVKTDIEFLIRCIERVSKNGIGAKTKLGWGRFRIEKIKKEENYGN